MNKELLKVMERTVKARKFFPMAVEATALEVTEIAKDIADAIGEISIDEAQNVVIREFAERLRATKYE